MRNHICSLLVTSLMLVAGTALAADTYNIDNTHSSVAFSAKHMVISNIKGTFEKIEGTIVYDANDITKSSVEISIEVASLNTRNSKRDGHLKSGDFFDAENHPTITFKSNKITKTDDGLVATGGLTIRGVTKEISFAFVLSGPITDPYGDTRIGIEVDTIIIKRHDFGISWNEKLDSGGLIVGKEVKIELAVEAVKS